MVLLSSVVFIGIEQLNNERSFAGNQDNMLKMVEPRTIQSDLNIDVIPPLVVVFLQFKICLWFPRHLYKKWSYYPQLFL